MSPSKDETLPRGPKTAIKGFSLSSKITSKTAKPIPSSSLGKRARPTTTFGEHDSDSEEERRGGRHEVVTGFGEEGAIREREAAKKGPLVIERLKNRDWRGEMGMKKGKGKNLLPAEVQAQRAEKEGTGKVEKEVDDGKVGETVWGLSVRKRVKIEDEDHTANMDEDAGKLNEDVKVEADVEENVEAPPSADDEALAALLGQKKEKPGPDLIIPSEIVQPPTQISEADAYKRAIASAPEASTLEDYEAIPVDEFGAAMLRGMGWMGETVKGGKDVKRRANLLGLGAKELKGAEELGAWVNTSDKKRLNNWGKGSGGGRPEKLSEYKRKEEERKERRGEGGYKREKERESQGGRDYRDRDRDSRDHRDRGHRDRDSRDRRGY